MKCWLLILVCIFFSFLKGARLVFATMEKAQSLFQQPHSIQHTAAHGKFFGMNFKIAECHLLRVHGIWGTTSAVSRGRGRRFGKKAAGFPGCFSQVFRLQQLHPAQRAPRLQKGPVLTTRWKVGSYFQCVCTFPCCFTVAQKTKFKNRNRRRETRRERSAGVGRGRTPRCLWTTLEHPGHGRM